MQMFWIDNTYRIYSKFLQLPIKRYSRTLIIREMQIKSTVRCHYIPLSMAIIKKTKDDKYGQGEKGLNSKEVPQRKLELPHDLAVLFCIYTWRKWNHYPQKITVSPTFIAALFTIAKT